MLLDYCLFIILKIESLNVFIVFTISQFWEYGQYLDMFKETYVVTSKALVLFGKCR